MKENHQDSYDTIETYTELGEVFWAKVGNHPWWPCMIYYDPEGEDFTRKSHLSISVHVQFFGPIEERAWVPFCNVIPYQGKVNLENYLAKKLADVPTKQKPKYILKVSHTYKEAWDDSCNEADLATTMDKETRIKKFGRLAKDVRRRLIPNEIKDKMIKLMDNVPISSKEDALAFQCFLNLKYQEAEVSNQLDRDIFEKEMLYHWNLFDDSNKRKYLSDPLFMFGSLKSKKPEKTPSRLSARNVNKTSEAPESIQKTVKPRKSVAISKPISSKKNEYDLEIHRLIVSPAQFRPQPVCQFCEVYSSTASQMFKCTGKCNRVLHPTCVKYTSNPPASATKEGTFKCNQCLTGEYLCRICDKKGSEEAPLFDCKISECGRSFHQKCIAHDLCASTSDSSGSFVINSCSSHHCNTCYIEQAYGSNSCGHKHNLDKSKTISCTDKGIWSEGPFLQCVRCPAAFHTNDLCTPAGAVEVSLSNIVCPKHFVSSLSNLPNFKTEKCSMCVVCLQSGADRLSCQYCPYTYHKKCLETLSTDSYYLDDQTLTCPRCLTGFQPRYGQIVWAKIPGFRWWPCEIIHARNAPMNILNMSHPEGAFPIHFLASDEYQWICRSRVYPYEIGIKFKPNLAPGSSRVEKAFNKAKTAAPDVHKMYVNYLWKKELPMHTEIVERLSDEQLIPPSTETKCSNNISGNELLDQKDIQSLFQSVEENLYSEAALEMLPSIREDMGPVVECGCKSADNQCTLKANCSNATRRYECNENNCGYGNKGCTNRSLTEFQNDSTVRIQLSVIRTLNRGYGLRVEEDIDQHSLALELLGEVITYQEANDRLSKSLQGKTHEQWSPENSSGEVCIINLTKQIAIDVTNSGNFARFINHSCDPNLEAICWFVNGKPRLGLFAKNGISKDDELTLDYRNSLFLCASLTGKGTICLCGGDDCRSILKLPQSFALSASHSVPSSKAPSVVTDDAASHTTPSPKKKPPPVASPDTPAVKASKALAPINSSDETKTLSAQVPAARKDTVKAKIKLLKESPDENLEDDNEEHENFCYRCGDGGELVLCDKSTCPKSYHLGCIGLSKPPSGIWYCPWHYCDDCGRPANRLCWRCPNSYCEKHGEDTSKICVEDLDADRWSQARSLLNIKTTEDDEAQENADGTNGHLNVSALRNAAIILSCRWICSDHRNIKIFGSSNLPSLLPTGEDEEYKAEETPRPKKRKTLPSDNSQVSKKNK